MDNDIKIVDVAKRAGVSTATVSRVLNNSDSVREATRRKVLAAIEELGYYPNAAAKNLRSQKSYTIGVIVSDINVSYYAEIIKGIVSVAYPNHFKVVICDADNNPDKEQDYLNLLLDRTVDAMIVAVPLLPVSKLQEYAGKGYTIGVVGMRVEDRSIPSVYTNNVEFSSQAMEHLIGQGHRDIAFLNGYPDAVDSYERLEGYLRSLRKHHIPFRPELIENGNFNEAGGYEAMMRLHAKGVKFTAVFAANDEMAFGVYAACEELGIAIPLQLAVVGVDNNRVSKFLKPALSTVEQPKHRMGAYMMETMISLLADKPVPDMTKLIASELLIRESSVSVGG